MLNDEDGLTPEEANQLEELKKKMTPERIQELIDSMPKLHSIPSVEKKNEVFERTEEHRPCLFCGKQLECAVDDWKSKQPYAGGEVQFIFSFGSTKFDNGMANTVYSALVCDDCAEKFVPQMTQETNLQ